MEGANCSCPLLRIHILYSRKYWRGTNFGELAICQRIADIKSAKFMFLGAVPRARG